MAWGALKTWVAGELVTAALLNEQLRDKLAELYKYTTKGDLVVATGPTILARLAVGENNQVLAADSTQVTGIKYAKLAALLPAAANGRAVIYDSAQASGLSSAPLYTELKQADLGSEKSNTTNVYTDALTTNVTLAAAGRIRVRAYGKFRGSALYVAPTVRLVIDGTADTFEAGYQINTDPADQSWRPFAIEWFRTGIADGSRQVKLQLKNNQNDGTAYLAAGARLVVEVDYP